MKHSCRARAFWLPLVLIAAILSPSLAGAEGDWETTKDSEKALQQGIQWLARSQGPEGNWTSNDLGLVSMGVLAFLSAGHMPSRGQYGAEVQRAMDYLLRNAQAKKEVGVLNISGAGRDMYNHGLTTFVLGQAYGMTGNARGDARIGPVLDRALKVIVRTQCRDGGWDYVANPQQNGHDLSLAVMQAKALRSAVDSGLEIPPEVIQQAIKSVRQHYWPSCGYGKPEEEQKRHPGQFTYSKGGGAGTPAMAAAGVVCLQEFAQYDDWRIEKNMAVIERCIDQWHQAAKQNANQPPVDAYTLYYAGQALYQVGGKHWQDYYPKLRDALVLTQVKSANAADNGKWQANGHVGGPPGELYMTASACFILAMPNRYLPILQEGRIDSLRRQFQAKP